MTSSTMRPRTAAPIRWHSWQSGFVAVFSLITASTAVAERPFFRPARSSTPPPSLSPAVPPTPVSGTPDNEPTLAAPAIPALKTPVLPLEVPPDSPRTVVALRPTGSACVSIDLSREYLNRLIATPRQDAGPVNDFVLGARVEGEQTTHTIVSIATRPSAQNARLDVVLEGETCSKTTAVTPQAAIDMTGKQRFDLHKSVEFDGARFITRSPGTQLDVCQQNHRARTGASGIPVVNSIAETIALNQANLRQPLARQEAARRVASRVIPSFNTAIDARLGAANDWLANLSTSLPRLYAFITSSRWSSTDQTITGELPGAAAVNSPAPPVRGGATVRVHESFMLSLATAAQLNGREITIEEIRRWIGIFSDDLRGSPQNNSFDLPPLTAPSDVSLRLADDEPLLAQYGNGEFRVILRVAIRAGEGVELPIHRITVGYSVRRAGDAFQLDPLPVSVIAESTATLVTGAVEQVIQSQIESRLQPVTIFAEAIPPMPNGKRPRVSDVVLENGWLTVVFD
jgi:hypothetical protein